MYWYTLISGGISLLNLFNEMLFRKYNSGNLVVLRILLPALSLILFISNLWNIIVARSLLKLYFFFKWGWYLRTYLFLRSLVRWYFNLNICKIPTFIMIYFFQCGWYLRGGAEASNGTCICKQKPAAVFGSNPWNLETGIWRGWIIMGVGAFGWGWRRGPGRQLSRLEALTLNCISLVCACRGKKQIADRTYKCTVRK